MSLYITHMKGGLWNHIYIFIPILLQIKKRKNVLQCSKIPIKHHLLLIWNRKASLKIVDMYLLNDNRNSKTVWLYLLKTFNYTEKNSDKLNMLFHMFRQINKKSLYFFYSKKIMWKWTFSKNIHLYKLCNSNTVLTFSPKREIRIIFNNQTQIANHDWYYWSYRLVRKRTSV